MAARSLSALQYCHNPVIILKIDSPRGRLYACVVYFCNIIARHDIPPKEQDDCIEHVISLILHCQNYILWNTHLNKW